MKVLDKVLLRNYKDKDPEEYLLARNLSLILLSLWVLLAVLLFRYLTTSQIRLTMGSLYIFIIVNLALALVLFDKIRIATPLTLIGINILSSSIVFSLSDFYLYEVYMLTAFQLTILMISALITYKQFYAYLMMIIGIISIILQFVYRGLKLDKALVLANYEDYIICLILLVLSGFILGRIITQKKRIMSKLKESEEKYSIVVNSSKDGIMIHQGGYIKFANDTALKLAGSFLNDTIDSFILDFVHPEHKEIAQKRLSSSNAGEEVSEVFEVKIINKDGTPMDVEVKRVDITFQEEKSVLLFIRDITERKRLQETLIQSEKMLSLGGLAAGMAHEINNPLAGIMQNAQVIMNRLEKDSPANRKSAEELGISLEAVRTFLHERKIFNHLRRIRESGSRAAEIITNMLNFARKEISKSTHDLRELLDKTVEMAGLDYDLKKKYDFRAIKIVRNYEEDLPLVPCDQGQIQQVFFNILKNGAEAMQESQEKEGNREESQFTLSAKQEGESVRVEIQNNLSGIPKELQGRIFEPFYTTKPVGAGTGLGLSVSYFIIKETHGGKLEVESDGSTWVKFIIELPVADH